jgi:hypothetical protein
MEVGKLYKIYAPQIGSYIMPELHAVDPYSPEFNHTKDAILEESQIFLVLVSRPPVTNAGGRWTLILLEGKRFWIWTEPEYHQWREVKS